MVNYWRLSGFYFFYYASLGVLVPYWGLYLKSLDFSPYQIGQQSALLLLTKIIAPYLWGWLADYTRRALMVVRVSALLALLCFLGVFVSTQYWWLTLVMVGYGFFWNAALPQVEATTLNHLGDRDHDYGLIRLWGSIGFIALVLTTGPVLDVLGAAVVPVLLTVLLFGINSAAILIPEKPVPRAAEVSHTPLRKLFRSRAVVALLASCLLMQMSHAPFYAFFSIYLTEFGYSKSMIGALWALGVLCEIGVFLAAPRLFRRFRLSTLLLIAFIATGFRWVLVAKFPQYLPVIALTQASHALTFGVYHATAIQYIHRLFRGSNQNRGQALYNSVSFGVGGGVGSFLSGYVWTEFGPLIMYLGAALLVIPACWLIVFWLRPYEDAAGISRHPK